MKPFERLQNGSGARRPADYVSARADVTVSEQFTVPEGATVVILSGTGVFHAAFGSNPTATVPADTDDGTACELINPAAPAKDRTFIVVPGEKIAVAASESVLVTASFYSQ